MKHKVEPVISKLGVFLLFGAASGALNAGALLNTADPTNGAVSIYSATFDGGLTACTGSSPPYCAFFGGDGTPGAIVTSPIPSGVINAYPGGIGCGAACPPATAPVPGAGSFLKLALSGGNTLLTLTGGTITFPTLTVVISGSTTIVTNGAGIVIDPTPVTVPVDGSGVAVFQVDLAPNFAADFSAFASIFTSCTGPLCPLVTVLNLDMVRYYLVIDYDPTFTSFTGSFAGQTGNNSIVLANLNSINVAATDTDGDTIPDAVDNCTLVSNANQRDTQTTPVGAPDGYGNICDPDLNNDGTVNINDFNRLKARLGITPVVDVDADLDGNGVININDLNRLKSFLGKPPGPSGLHPNCPPTCP